MPSNSRSLTSMGCFHLQPCLPLWHLVLSLLVYSLTTWWNVTVLFPWIDDNCRETPALRLLGTYLPHAVQLLVSVWLMLMVIGRLTLQELGVRRGFWLGVAGTIAYWAATQTWVVGVRLGAGEALDWKGSQQLLLQAIDLSVSQFFGNAMLEEVFFRGYLFVQLQLLLSRLFDRRSQSESPLSRFGTESFVIALAGLASVAIFVALHLPIRISSGMSGERLFQSLMSVTLWGIVFTVLFVATRNLWLVIGIHALTNRPCMLWEAPQRVRAEQLWLSLLVIGIAMIWSWRNAKPQREST